MKLGFLLFILSFSAFSKEEWKKIAETASCREKVSIEAKIGENFVYAIHQGKKRKLVSNDKTPYQKFRSKSLIYKSDTTHEKYELGEPTFDFSWPSTVMSNIPTLTIFYSGTYFKCEMTYKD